MTVIVFLAVNVIGNPVDVLISPDASQADRARAIHDLGLDQPLWRQYAAFLGNALHGDLGRSFVYNVPALQLILQHMPATMELAVAAVLLSVLVGVPLGLYAGLRPRSVLSRLIVAGSILGFSLPSFWVGLMTVVAFSVQLGWLPSSGRGRTVEVFGTGWSFLTLDGLRHMVLPALNLALFNIAVVLRLTRSGTQEVLPPTSSSSPAPRACPRAHRGRPRAEAHRRPPGHGRRAGVRVHRGLRRGHGDGVRLARHGQADHRQHQRARPPGDRRLPDDDRHAVRRHQPGRRPALHGAGPPDAAGPADERGDAGATRRRACACCATSRPRPSPCSACCWWLLTAAVALLAPWISPQNPYDLSQLDITDARLPPGSLSSAGFTFLLGSDGQGRDMLSGIFYGLALSLLVGVGSAAFAAVLGTSLGLLAAYAGGWVDGAVIAVGGPATVVPRPS